MTSVDRREGLLMYKSDNTPQLPAFIHVVPCINKGNLPIHIGCHRGREVNLEGGQVEWILSTKVF